MRLDLRGVRIGLQPQGLDEFPRERGPVEPGRGRQVGVEIADGAVHLAERRLRVDLPGLARQAVGEVGDLLAEGGR